MWVSLNNWVFKFIKRKVRYNIVNLATLFPGSGNPVSSYNFLNVTIKFFVAQNMGIATITILKEAK